jgi:hypothetical protein
MAETQTIKTPSFISPDPETLTNLYVVPAETQSIISTINVCNTTASSNFFRIAATSGGSPTTGNYLVYNMDIEPYETVSFTQGITLDSNDLIAVYAASAGLAFNLFKMEVTQ